MTRFDLRVLTGSCSEASMRNHAYSVQPLAHIRRHGDETVWTATGHERPVFLDEHGRRRRWVLAGGALAGSACAFWLTALIAGSIGFSTLPSMRAHSSLAAERAEARVVQVPRHRHTATAAGQRPSTLERATGLAVSRALIAER
jgi:hypothetical protein